MRTILVIVMIILVFPVLGHARQVDTGFGGFDLRNEVPCLSERQRARLYKEMRTNTELLLSQGMLPEADANLVVHFQWPVRAAASLTDYGCYGVSGFVDHDPTYPGNLSDWNCGARTYDLDSGYNHQGTDIFNWPFYWNKMDNDEVEVACAQLGTIVHRQDGNYDRSCGFDNAGDWNGVAVRHGDGSIAVYGHFKNGSVTSKQLGEVVLTGEYLGIVGSSGFSTGPHLHFEVVDVNNNLIDPFSGPCNSLNPTTWWANQKPYYEPAINKISTHSAPVEWGTCPDPDVTNESNLFKVGDDVYYYIFGKDGLRLDEYTMTVRRPDGTVMISWPHTNNEFDFYPAYYYFWSLPIPLYEQTGDWKFEVVYKGETYEHVFNVGTVPVVFHHFDAFVDGGSVILTWDLAADEVFDGFAGRGWPPRERADFAYNPERVDQNPRQCRMVGHSLVSRHRCFVGVRRLSVSPPCGGSILFGFPHFHGLTPEATKCRPPRGLRVFRRF